MQTQHFNPQNFSDNHPPDTNHLAISLAGQIFPSLYRDISYSHSREEIQAYADQALDVLETVFRLRYGVDLKSCLQAPSEAQSKANH